MARQLVGIGSSANDGTGDTLRDGIDKVNDNFIEIYGKIGDGTTIGTFTTTGITSTGDFTINGSADIILDADGGDIFFKDGATTFGSATNTSGNLIIKSGTTTNLTMSGANITSAGVVTATGFTIGSAAILEAELEILDGATVTTTELNLLDGGTSVGASITLADADGFIVNDAGTMKSIPASDIKTYTGGSAADELTVGDAAVTITTSSGNITIDAAANDSDIIFKGTDATADITMLTLDGSEAGAAIFNSAITGGGLLTTGGNIVIPNAGNIGSAGDTDAIAIASDGVVTFSQNPVGTLATAAQTNITSLGTLTALTVDDVVIDGKVMTMTGSSSDTAVFTAGTNGTLSIVTTDAAAAAANIQITADGTAELAGTTVTLDSEGDIVLDANGADIFFKDDGTTFGSATNSSGNLIVKSGTTTALTFAGANVTAAGTVDSGAITSTGVVTGTGFTIGSAAILEAELEILDGATVTTTELNLLDGGTDVGGGITVADADGFIVNDAGTMKTIPATSVKTYAATTVTVPASYNMIINGDMSVAQRGKTITDAAVANVSTTSNADDSYTLDRWILISDGDNIVDVTQEHDGPTTGGPKSIRLDVETVDKQFGIVQWIEHINCSEAIGGNVSLSFSMKVTGAKMDDVRAAVVSWSGTRDAPTSDIVATWESEGTVPTLASSCTYENTAADLSPTTSWARYTIENVSVDTSSTANIGVFIWSGVDDTDAGNFLYVTDVQLETSASAHAFKRQPVSQTMKDCERYYETSMDWGQDQQYAGQKVVYGLGSATYAATVSSIGGIQYRTRKRLSPTVVIYDQDGLAGSVYTIHSGTRVSSTVAAQHTIDYGFLFATKTNAFSHGYAYYYAYTAESEL